MLGFESEKQLKNLLDEIKEGEIQQERQRQRISSDR